ncbi:hypothetical protein I4I80_02470 [Pseudomonas syringae pv. tomato]|nr:hypothetical protein [Pseudomonas syringae pv. tomato]
MRSIVGATKIRHTTSSNAPPLNPSAFSKNRSSPFAEIIFGDLLDFTVKIYPFHFSL